MARDKRSKATTFLLRLFRRIPMPLLSILIGLVVGLAVWGLLDRLQGDAVRDLFQEDLRLRLEQRSRENLIRFDQYVGNYAATTRLLANHRRLALYLEPLFWFSDEEVQPVVYDGFVPYWLPDFIGRNALNPPSHALLVDGRGRVREIYRTGKLQLPASLAAGIDARFLDDSRVRTVLARFDDRLFLVVSDAADDARGFSMGYLLLIIPVDAHFLGASQQGSAHSGDLVAVIDANSRRILASSEPETLVPGTPVKRWSGDYQVTTQPVSEYGGSESDIQFATFMSHANVAAMSRQVRGLAERQRLISALVFIAVFTLVIFLVSARLNRVLKRISRFSQRALGYRAPPRNASGNQLLLLEDQVRRFINLVLAAREEMRLRHESEIRATEALKSAILEASLDTIVTIDGAGNIVELNPTAELSFGHRRDAVVGRSFAGLFLDAVGQAQFLSLIGGGGGRTEGQAHGFVRGELEALRADGSRVPVEISIVPIQLESTPLYTVYLHDISSRKEAERKIRNLARFASESPSPVLRVNAQGVILYANGASRPLLAYWGCSPGQTLPLFWCRRVAQVLEAGGDAEWNIDCDSQVFSLLFAPVADQGYVNLYGRDVTAVRRAEQEARQHQAELVHVCRLSTMGEMATGMAHELNQPLSAIANFANGCSRRLQSGIGGTGELVDAMGQITSQAQRASEIIRRLRGMVGRQPAQRETVDINYLVREVCSFVEFDAGREGVEIGLELSARALPVRVDLVQIEQVLLNLVRNALDALEGVPKESRTIVIRTRQAGLAVQVEIRDQGPGIDPDTERHLFDAFFSTKASGMGMGLPISKTIMEEHNGSIRVSSRPGEGASFFVQLPAVQEQDVPLEAAGM